MNLFYKESTSEIFFGGRGGGGRGGRGEGGEGGGGRGEGGS